MTHPVASGTGSGEPGGADGLEGIGPVMQGADVVLVPRGPGPLTALDGPRAPQDEIDVAIDELFGDGSDDRPSRFDTALIALGAVILGWSLLTGSGAALIGGILLVLGLALPTQSFVRRIRSRQAASKRRTALARGYPLAISDPEVLQLATAYEALLTTAASPDVDRGAEAIAVAHLALVEAATLLGGRTPEPGPETEYIRRRTEGIERLERSIRARLQRIEPEGVMPSNTDAGWSAAVTRARDELEGASGLASVDQLAALNREIAKG